MDTDIKSTQPAMNKLYPRPQVHHCKALLTEQLLLISCILQMLILFSQFKLQIHDYTAATAFSLLTPWLDNMKVIWLVKK